MTRRIIAGLVAAMLVFVVMAALIVYLALRPVQVTQTTPGVNTTNVAPNGNTQANTAAQQQNAPRQTAPQVNTALQAVASNGTCPGVRFDQISGNQYAVKASNSWTIPNGGSYHYNGMILTPGIEAPAGVGTYYGVPCGDGSSAQPAQQPASGSQPRSAVPSQQQSQATGGQTKVSAPAQQQASVPAASPSCPDGVREDNDPGTNPTWSPAGDWRVVNFWTNRPGADQKSRKLLLSPDERPTLLGGGDSHNWPNGCEEAALKAYVNAPNKVTLAQLKAEGLVAN